MTDAELITAARGGDAPAWGELYARWLPWVWRYAYSQVGDRHVAEDITSEAMIAWVGRLQESDIEAPRLAAWLRQVVRNKAADHFRRSGRFRKAVEGVATLNGGPPRREGGAAPIEHEEKCRRVRDTLEELPENHRMLLEWKYAEKMSVRDIATRMGTTEKSVEAALYRARSEFRRRIELADRQDDLPPLLKANGDAKAKAKTPRGGKANGSGRANADGQVNGDGQVRLEELVRGGRGGIPQSRTCQDEV